MLPKATWNILLSLYFYQFFRGQVFFNLSNRKVVSPGKKKRKRRYMAAGKEKCIAGLSLKNKERLKNLVISMVLQNISLKILQKWNAVLEWNINVHLINIEKLKNEKRKFLLFRIFIRGWKGLIFYVTAHALNNSKIHVKKTRNTTVAYVCCVYMNELSVVEYMFTYI